VKPFSPSSFNFGLLPALQKTFRKIGKKEKHALLCTRASDDFTTWKNALC
jgi:folate-dependent tRNA-U54 methylase TrmFO/GidA